MDSLGSLHTAQAAHPAAGSLLTVNDPQAEFRQRFLRAVDDHVITSDEWQDLYAFATAHALPFDEALGAIRPDILRFIEKTLLFACADGKLDVHERRYIKSLIEVFKLSDSEAKPLFDRMNYLRRLMEIRTGKLPVVKPSVLLESDEICHHETVAVYHKQNAKSVSHVPGSLIATNQRLHFVSSRSGRQMDWRKLMRLEIRETGLWLEMTGNSGGGFYQVPDPILTDACCEALVRISKRQMAEQRSSSRHIPQGVKNAVWQRDQGRCVECQATAYLEFDHIIPFSKGGASTAANIQILCRQCNNQKKARL